jgi:tetratricopeptide (TPR) repeat protein
MPPFKRLLAVVVTAGIRLALLAVAGGPSPTGATSQAADIAGIEPLSPVCALETRLLEDARDGRWDEHSLFAAALVAGGVTSETELRGTCDLFAVIAAELKSELRHSVIEEERAARALAFLHRRLLAGGYELGATELPRVLATGRYNCVSATVLFNCLAAEAGLNVGAVRLPNHTYSVIWDSSRPIRVEATCADWFAASEPPRTTLGGGEEMRFLASSRSGGEVPDAISDVALVAMIYYNRGVESLKRASFRQAILLNRRALLLDPHNAQARGNLLSAINKQALSLAAQKQFQDATALVDEGLAIDPAHAALRHNRELISRARGKVVD